jgi:hypothetical protein
MKWDGVGEWIRLTEDSAYRLGLDNTVMFPYNAGRTDCWPHVIYISKRKAGMLTLMYKKNGLKKTDKVEE